MTKKKSKAKQLNALSSIVTWVGDPSHLNKSENEKDPLDSEFADDEELERNEGLPEGPTEDDLADEENLDSQGEDGVHNTEELEESLDAESGETPPDFNPPNSQDLEEQLDRISKLLNHQADLQEVDPIVSSSTFDPEKELALQIAEDMALEQSQNAANQELLDSGSGGTGNFLQTALNFDGDEIPIDLAEIQSCIEALLFISDKPLSTAKLKELLAPELNRELFQDAVTGLCEKYQQVAHGIEVVEIAGGYQFRTKAGRASLAQKLAKVQTQRLSGGAMESLAIIAYRQPVMKEDIDKVRGVDSSYFIRGLMDKKLIKISGRSELPGRPVLYTTTQEFLELFGLRDLSSLPSLRELEQMIPNSQSANPEDEDPRIRTMRRLVGEMNVDGIGALKYDPKEDEKLLKEFRERITAIPSSTPYLDEMKAAEILAKQQLALQQQQEQGLGTSLAPEAKE